jgi:hypothetical protein
VPTRLLLEGRDLEELLAQVRDEHGPEAKVVSAEKIRTGGIGGLFGHQKYELTVEIQDSAPSAEPAAPTVATLTIDDLAAMADAADLRGSPPTSEEVLASAAGAGPSFAGLLADVQDPSPVLTTSTVMADEVGEVTDVPESAAEPPSVRPFRPNANQPVAKLGMKPLNALEPEPTAIRQETSMPVEVSEALVTIDRPRTGDSSERLAATYGSTLSAPSSAAPTGSTATHGAGSTATHGAGSPHITASPNGSAASNGSAPPHGSAAPTKERPTGLPRRLQSLGVPADIAFRATAADTYTAIVEAFSALPIAEPAPDGPGETLVVIGESTNGVEVSRSVATVLRLELDDILFAGRNAAAAGISQKHRITGAHDARMWAKRLRKSDAPSVVAIEAALDESNWAASIVEAIRPVAVWVVVDASRKTPDVAHHLQGLRRVDAIALRATGSSGDPASPLSLRQPVALLDGHPPTPHAWAAMLCERLSLVGG